MSQTTKEANTHKESQSKKKQEDNSDDNNLLNPLNPHNVAMNSLGDLQQWTSGDTIGAALGGGTDNNPFTPW